MASEKVKQLNKNFISLNSLKVHVKNMEVIHNVCLHNVEEKEIII